MVVDKPASIERALIGCLVPSRCSHKLSRKLTNNDDHNDNCSSSTSNNNNNNNNNNNKREMKQNQRHTTATTTCDIHQPACHMTTIAAAATRASTTDEGNCSELVAKDKPKAYDKANRTTTTRATNTAIHQHIMQSSSTLCCCCFCSCKSRIAIVKKKNCNCFRLNSIGTDIDDHCQQNHRINNELQQQQQQVTTPRKMLQEANPNANANAHANCNASATTTNIQSEVIFAATSSIELRPITMMWLWPTTTVDHSETQSISINKFSDYIPSTVNVNDNDNHTNGDMMQSQAKLKPQVSCSEKQQLIEEEEKKEKEEDKDCVARKFCSVIKSSNVPINNNLCTHGQESRHQKSRQQQRQQETDENMINMRSTYQELISGAKSGCSRISTSSNNKYDCFSCDSRSVCQLTIQSTTKLISLFVFSLLLLLTSRTSVHNNSVMCQSMLRNSFQQQPPLASQYGNQAQQQIGSNNRIGGYNLPPAAALINSYASASITAQSAASAAISAAISAAMSSSGVQIFEGNRSTIDHFKLIERDGDSLLVGARNVIYNISLTTLKENKRLEWPASEDDIHMCRVKGKSSDACQNYIRVMVKTSQESLFVCGTNAYKPRCRSYHISDDGYEMVSEKPGEGMCPYQEHQNVTFTFADNDLYVATAAQFSGIDALILRSPLRTEQFNPKQLNAPNFVASFAYGEHVYFLFREIAVEYMNCGKAVYSRIARVCINDQGAAGHKSSRANGWTSFVKARLNCSLAGEFPYYFDQIQAASPVVSGTYNGARVDLVYAVLTTPPVEGGPALGASAVCAFTMPDVLDAFNGPFKGQEDTNSNWLPLADSKMPVTRPGTCVADSRRLPDDTVTFVLNNPLMDRAVPSMWSRPLVVAPSLAYRYTQIAVDPQIELPYHVQHHGQQPAHLDVVFVATDDGRIVKLTNTFALVPDVAHHHQQQQQTGSSSFDDTPPINMDFFNGNNNNNNGWSLALTSNGQRDELRRTKPEPSDTIIVEQVHVFDVRTPIVALHVYRREHHTDAFNTEDLDDNNSNKNEENGAADDEPKLIVVSAQQIKAIPLYRCERVRTCSECVALRDPYCGWDLVRSVCRAHRQTRRTRQHPQQQHVPPHKMHRASLPHRHDGTVLQATATSAQQRAQRQRLTSSGAAGVATANSNVKHDFLVQNLTAGWSAQCPDAPSQRFYQSSQSSVGSAADVTAGQSSTSNSLNECLTFCQAAAANGAEPTMGGALPQASCEYTCASLATAPVNHGTGDAPALNYVPGAGLESQGYAGVNLFHPSIVTTLNGQNGGASSNISWPIWMACASALVLGLMFGFLWGRIRGRRTASGSSSKQDSSICSSTFDANTNMYMASAAHHHQHISGGAQHQPMLHPTHTHLSHHQLNNGNSNHSNYYI